jgi:hypothetical protein
MGGLGIEVGAGPGHVYFATRIVVPANNVNGVAIDVVVPFSANLDLGYRIPIGGGGKPKPKRRH